VNRITAEQVVEAYKVTGYRPARKTMWSKTNKGDCACALVACSAAKVYPLKNEETDWEHYLCQTLEIERTYMLGFISGFDGYTQAVALMDEVAKEGYADGLAAAAAVFGVGSTEGKRCK